MATERPPCLSHPSPRSPAERERPLIRVGGRSPPTAVAGTGWEAVSGSRSRRITPTRELTQRLCSSARTRGRVVANTQLRVFGVGNRLDRKLSWAHTNLFFNKIYAE
jgi:hypothetical protein